MANQPNLHIFGLFQVRIHAFYTLMMPKKVKQNNAMLQKLYWTVLWIEAQVKQKQLNKPWVEAHLQVWAECSLDENTYNFRLDCQQLYSAT